VCSDGVSTLQTTKSQDFVFTLLVSNLCYSQTSAPCDSQAFRPNTQNDFTLATGLNQIDYLYVQKPNAAVVQTELPLLFFNSASSLLSVLVLPDQSLYFVHSACVQIGQELAEDLDIESHSRSVILPEECEAQKAITETRQWATGEPQLNRKKMRVMQSLEIGLQPFEEYKWWLLRSESERN